MTIPKEWRTMTFRTEEFKILLHVYRRRETGELFEYEGFAQLNYQQVISQYNEKATPQSLHVSLSQRISP